MADAYKLNGKVALVTGASRGLGAAIARELASQGARTAVNYFGSAAKAQETVNAILAAGGIAQAVQADVRDPGQIQKMIAAISQAWGPVEILVANATGPQPMLKLEEMTWQDCLNQLEFFVKSPLLLTQAVLPEMKRRKAGRIIQIGSEVFEKGVPGFSSYVSAKGAQLGLTRSWAMELAPWGITVNLVAPGWIPTERHAGDAQADKDAYAKNVPLQHMGVPRDVALAVSFLASDAGGFVTGQKLSVNGGNTLE